MQPILDFKVIKDVHFTLVPAKKKNSLKKLLKAQNYYDINSSEFL